MVSVNDNADRARKDVVEIQPGSGSDGVIVSGVAQLVDEPLALPLPSLFRSS